MAKKLETCRLGSPCPIVIPVYNGAGSIGDLVCALENLQIAGGHEIVLVNDGSADDSLAICRMLFERRAYQ